MTIKEIITEEIINKKNYIIEKETEKAIFVKIPYWLETNKLKSKHEQRYLEFWVPKSQIQNDIIPEWIIEKQLKELESKNRYIVISSIKKHLGEIAPVKKQVIETIPDEEKQREYKNNWIKTLPKDYQHERLPIDSYYKNDPPPNKTDKELEREYNYHQNQITKLTKKVKYYI